MTKPNETSPQAAPAAVAWRVRSYLNQYEITQRPEIVKDWHEAGLDVEPLFPVKPAPPVSGDREAIGYVLDRLVEAARQTSTNLKNHRPFSVDADGRAVITCELLNDWISKLRFALRAPAQGDGVREALMKARDYIEYALDTHGNDIAGAGLVALNATDAALATLPPSMGGERNDEWQDISTAPKDGTQFAAYEDGDVFKCHWTTQSTDEGPPREGWFDHVNQSLEAPTLWIPLPVGDGRARVKSRIADFLKSSDPAEYITRFIFERWVDPARAALQSQAITVEAARDGRRKAAAPTPSASRGMERESVIEALEQIEILSKNMEGVKHGNETVMKLVRQIIGIHAVATKAIRSLAAPQGGK